MTFDRGLSVLALLAITLTAAQESSYYNEWNNTIEHQQQDGGELAEATSRDCRQVFRGPAFRVYPGSLPAGTVCSYVIEAFSPHVCQLEVTFPAFKIGCHGAATLTIAGEAVCGSPPHTRVFPFSQPRDVVRYRADERSTFDLRVRQIECPPPSPTCGGVFSRPQFALQSPNYPLAYPDDAHCVYVIKASSPGICDLDFFLEDFDLGASPDCSTDRLEIGNQPALCGRKSGRIRYHDFLGELRLTFLSDRVGAEKGFKILVTQIPCTRQNLTQPLADSDNTSRLFPIRPSVPHYCPPNQPPIAGPPIYPPTHPYPPAHPYPPIYPPIYPPVSPIPPIYRPNPPPVYPPILPVPPIYPPIYPPVQPVPPIYPPVQPAPPFFPIPIPPNLPQCCSRPYNDQHLFISSPNFPHNPQGNVDCVYAVRRFTPQTCRLRLHFRYLLVGNERNGCDGGWLNLDGRMICGCHTGHSLVIEFDQWEAVKLMRYKTFVGFGKNTMQGFVIKVHQEECFRFKRDSTSNVTIDQNYRKTRYNPYFKDLQDNENGNKNNYTDRLYGSFSTNLVKDVFIYDNNPTKELVGNEDIQEEEERRDNTNVQNVLGNKLNLAELPLSPPIFPHSNFVSNINKSEVSSPHHRNITDNPSMSLPSTQLELPTEKSSSFSSSNSSSQIVSTTFNGNTLPISVSPNDDTSKSSKVSPENEPTSVGLMTSRLWQPSCLAAGFTQWLALAKEFLWTGQASCPSHPPPLPPSPPPLPPPEQRCIVLDQPRGVIQSYGYPLAYPNYVNCCYRFQASPGICRIELIMMDFSLENSKFCHKDFFMIGGKKRYCGTSLAGTSTMFDVSRVHFATARFVTDATRSDRGFRGQYRQLPCGALPPAPAVCGRVVRGATFHLTHDTTCSGVCVFTVVKPDPSFCELQLAFARFSLVCGREFLEVGGERLCGDLSGRTNIFNAPGNELTMVFSTSLGAGRGFELYGLQVPECDPFMLNVTPARISEELTQADNSTQPRPSKL